MHPATHLAAIHLAPARRAPVQSVDSVVVDETGLVGDRWHGSRHRHVSVQSLDDLRAAAHDLGRDVAPAATRRNLTLSAGAVPTTPGARLRIGEVELEVVRVAAPCRVMDETLGPGGRTALRSRGGSVFRVVHAGVLSVGDEVVLLGNPQP